MFKRKLPPFLMLDGEPVEGGGDTPTPDPAPADPAAPATAPAATETEKKAPWAADDFDPERAWKLIQNKDADLAAEREKREKAITAAREEAAQKAREDTYREFGKQLGIVKDDEAPTVEGLQSALQEKDATLTTTQARNLALTVENAVLRFADAHGADAGALSDSSSFAEKLKALDSTADDYATQVEALVKTTVESNPRYRKVQVAPSNSNGNPAPAGGKTEPGDDIESLRAAYRKSRGVKD